jgi:hypothetical protein
MKENVPYFIQIRGCINCSASKAMKEAHGTDYGFDHEILASCLIQGCCEWGHDLMNPFIDPEELVRIVKIKPVPEYIEEVKKILQGYEDSYGIYFKQIGVDLKQICLQSLSAEK